ncbi:MULTISPECIES: stationary-phase-induced ribosome-associated protein [Serratia]|uniref:stationary-phase-induced ribosome-associated protein n=1 Tax=Serratia TaxID=613 RepID=UPI00113FD32A|nr:MULTISPECIES: stationary-phase-induced ribosome-associated protein [Serratia]MEB7886170.1 stationary-phase-induced ribosome-associated protein [Serratia fonticola]
MDNQENKTTEPSGYGILFFSTDLSQYGQEHGMKTKTNRKARRALGMAHWVTNRVQITPSACGKIWTVAKKKK